MEVLYGKASKQTCPERSGLMRTHLWEKWGFIATYLAVILGFMRDIPYITLSFQREEHIRAILSRNAVGPARCTLRCGMEHLRKVVPLPKGFILLQIWMNAVIIHSVHLIKLSYLKNPVQRECNES